MAVFLGTRAWRAVGVRRRRQVELVVKEMRGRTRKAECLWYEGELVERVVRFWDTALQAW